jgi:AcrR family transcriptional regulator
MAARAGRRRGGESVGAQARSSIVDAAVACLATDGFSATSARAVAERAGIAPGGVFYHFGSMDELLAVVFERCLDARLARMATVLEAPPAALPEALRDAVQAEFAHPEGRALLELVVGAASSPMLADRVRVGIERSFTFTRGVVDRMLDGSPLAAVLPLDLVAQIAASAFFGLQVLDLVGTPIDVEAMTTLVAALTRLGTPDPSPAPGPG